MLTIYNMRVRDMLYTHDIYYEFRRGVFWKKFFHYLKSKHTLRNFGQRRNTFETADAKNYLLCYIFQTYTSF